MTPNTFAQTCRSLALHLKHADTPWRPAVGVGMSRRQRGPAAYRTPANLAAVDLEVEVFRELSDILAPVLQLLGEDAPPRPREPNGTAVAVWLAKHADTVYPWLDDEDFDTVAGLNYRLLRHHGYRDAVHPSRRNY